MSLSFVRDVYNDGRAASLRSHPPIQPTTRSTLVASDRTSAAFASSWPARIVTVADNPASAGWLSRGMPPIAAPHPRRPYVHSVVVPATLMHMPGAAWSGAAIRCSCSCHFGDNGCDLLPGAARLYHTCDGRPVA